MTRSLYDSRNNRIDLGPELGAGGEGAVFEVVGQPSSVAKVYHKPPDARHGQKLRLMASLARPDLLKVAAWPTATLHQTPQGPILGVVMPRVSGHKEVHTLYSPAHRKKDFPTADWAFLIHTAMNCAIAFDAVHQGGHAIGDVNQSNVMVAPKKSTVYLIDCDSYQVSAGGQVFPCEVGVPLYTPPELQGQSFHGVARTQNHDRFGLAVLIFHLLFVGRHPFSGRPLTRADLPIEKAIKEFRFAFSRAAAQLQIAPPPHAPLLDIIPPEVAGLFERAFGKQSVQPGARPTAQEWIAALGGLLKRLKVCGADDGHTFSSHLSQCCWCALMRGGSPNYFVSVAIFRLGATASSLTFVLGPAWAEIDRVPRPSTVYQRPAPPSGTIAPTVLPAHITSRVPPPVVIPPPHVPPPAPAPRSHIPPPVAIPPPRVQAPAPVSRSHVPPLVVIARKSLHTAVGWAAVGSLCLLPVVLLFLLIAVVVTPAPLSSGGESFAALGVFGALVGVSSFTFGVGWLFLEMQHQTAVRTVNASRDAILAELAEEQRRRQAAYAIAVQKAQAEWKAKVQRANADRNAILAEVEREDARRREAYKFAVQKAQAEWKAKVQRANAEREAILTALEQEKARRLQVYRDARRGLEEAENNWRRTAAWYEQTFDALKRDLGRLRGEYLSLKPQYDEEYRRLERNKEAVQRRQFLQAQFISDHDIPNIGPAREAILRSNGIETAYDVERDRILSINGFGPALANNLLVWREHISRQFRFDAKAAISPSELAPLVLKYRQLQQRMEAKAQAGLTELRDCSEKASRHLSQLYAETAQLVVRLAQAKIDAEAVSADAA